jgi:endonuclease III
MAALEAERRALLQSSQEANLEQRRQLMHLRGIGSKEAWLLVMACFRWRVLKNRREVGGLEKLLSIEAPH